MGVRVIYNGVTSPDRNQIIASVAIIDQSNGARIQEFKNVKIVEDKSIQLFGGAETKSYGKSNQFNKMAYQWAKLVARTAELRAPSSRIGSN